MPTPRVLYLHGFSSSPQSKKAVVFRDHLAPRGLAVHAVDLRVPALETLRVSSMIDAAAAAIDAGSPRPERERAIVIGSSLGGLTAAKLAERDARVCALVLLAPAFGFGARWRARLGAAAVDEWRRTGWYAMGGDDPDAPPRLDIGFLDDALAVEAAGPVDVRVPTLVVHGTKDDAVPIASSRAWAKGKPHVRVVELDDGHQLYGTLDRICVELDRFLFGA